MAVEIPKDVLDQQVLPDGLKMIHQGKVRNSFALPGYPKLMLVVATDRISVFDFVLNALIPSKGAVLTALNHFWTLNVLRGLCPTDFVAGGTEIDQYLPEHLHGNLELQMCGTVVQSVQAPDVEDIVRFILTGSGWKSYQGTQMVCGHKLPPGLTDGSLLPEAIYTPTTKASVGHDEHISAESVEKRYPGRAALALKAAKAIAGYAETRGIVLADTKFEFGLADDGTLVLVDEKGTPDSSRMVDKDVWLASQGSGKFPASLDKQRVRNVAKAVGIDANRRPENTEDVEIVHSWPVPDEVIRDTTQVYRYLFRRLTGLDLEDYQREHMGINTAV